MQSVKRFVKNFTLIVIFFTNTLLLAQICRIIQINIMLNYLLNPYLLGFDDILIFLVDLMNFLIFQVISYFEYTQPQ